MVVSRLSLPNKSAELGIGYASEISHAAGSFGARSHREARLHPGSFDRPVVGHDPSYFARQAAAVLRKAVRADPELSDLYLQAWSLSSGIERATGRPHYALGGPSVNSAVELVEVTTAIQDSLAEKDLRIRLKGRWLERAADVCDFAVRVIEMSPNRMLYPGLPPETPTNTLDYWLGATDQLITPAA